VYPEPDVLESGFGISQVKFRCTAKQLVNITEYDEIRIGIPDRARLSKSLYSNFLLFSCEPSSSFGVVWEAEKDENAKGDYDKYLVLTGLVRFDIDRSNIPDGTPSKMNNHRQASSPWAPFI
jgi:hypothetical protein